MTKRPEITDINQPMLDLTEEQQAKVEELVDDSVFNYHDARVYVTGTRIPLPEGFVDSALDAEDLAS